MKELEPIAIFNYIMSIVFLILIGSNAKLNYIKPLDGKCFPDYRPGFGCYVWEKLP